MAGTLTDKAAPLGKRVAFFAYGAVTYLIFFATFLYMVGWVSEFLVPRSINSGDPRSLNFNSALIDAALLLLFACQHSIMARQWFKRAWTRIVPEPLERSTYVLFACMALILMVWQWRPIGGVVWEVSSEPIRSMLMAICGLGFCLVLVSTFLINHFDLFGLRQVYLYLKGQPYRHLGFRTPGLYRFVRHPLYLGFLLAFWATPNMTVAHLLFAIATTGYILVAIRFEERDLIVIHGERYRRYRDQVSMLVPGSPAAAERVTAQSA